MERQNDVANNWRRLLADNGSTGCRAVPPHRIGLNSMGSIRNPILVMYLPASLTSGPGTPGWNQPLRVASNNQNAEFARSLRVELGVFRF